METTRIFVKGLPPTITEAEFRKHFSAKNREITDLKLIPQRRIGYVGYKTPEDASGAVKYFNRSYIRMSKISVEPAKPVGATRDPACDLYITRTYSDGMIDLRPSPEQEHTISPFRSSGGEPSTPQER